MAITAFRNGYTLTAAGDAIPNTRLAVTKVAIVKTTAGTVSFSDGTNTVLTTASIGNGAALIVDFCGWVCPKFAYSAVSAGSAVVTVFLSEPPHANLAAV